MEQEDTNTSQKEERKWAMAVHLSSLIGFIVPLGNILAPLVIWAIKKDQYPLVNDQGREVMNFQISMFIYSVVAGFLCMILIGFPLLVALLVFDVVCTVKASMKAEEGVQYRYPYCIRFFK